MMYCQSELNRSVCLLGFPLEVELLACDVGVFCCSLLVVKLCEHLYVWLLNALFLQGLPKLLCSMVSNVFLKPVAATQRGSLSELLEREQVVCRGVDQSEACLVSRLDGV